jgi:hypothetical protein
MVNIRLDAERAGLFVNYGLLLELVAGFQFGLERERQDNCGREGEDSRFHPVNPPLKPRVEL